MPKLETLVANPVAQPGPGNAPDVSSPFRTAARGIDQLVDIGERIVDAEYTGRSRRASAAAERELYELGDRLNQSTDYEAAEEAYETQSREIVDRYRSEISGRFYQDAFDESTGAFNERIRHGVRAGVRSKRIDAAKAELDAEQTERATVYGAFWNDPVARDNQREQYYGSVAIQEANGTISRQEAVNYRQGFDELAERAAAGKNLEVRIHQRVLEVTASAGSREEALKMADASDPDIAQDVFQRVSARVNAAETGRKDLERAAIDQTYPMLENAFRNGVRYGPGEHDVHPPGPEAAQRQLDALNLPPHLKIKFEKQIGAMVTSKDLADEGLFAREYDRLTLMREDKKQRVAFLDEDLNALRLQFPNYRTQVDALIADQRGMREGVEPTATESKRAAQLYGEMFDVRLTAGGEAKYPRDRERLAKFRLHYEIAYQERSKVLGRRLDRDEERKLAGELVQPLAGEDRYRFELPPRRAPMPRARPAPGAPPAARLPPQPEQAAPFTDVGQNMDLAIRAEMAILERTGQAGTEAEILAEMNKLRGAARE